jgi:hypothetical protein
MAMGRSLSAPAQPHKNGVLRLGDLTPERREIELNGRVLKAWVVANQRYPASIAAELEDARQDYLESRVPVLNPEPGPDLAEAVRGFVNACEDEIPGTAILQEGITDLREALKRHEEPRFRIRATEWERYVTAALMILVPGLEDWEADMLGPEMRLKILQELGYFRGSDEPVDPTTEEENLSIGVEPLQGSPDSSM